MFVNLSIVTGKTGGVKEFTDKQNISRIHGKSFIDFLFSFRNVNI